MVVIYRVAIYFVAFPVFLITSKISSEDSVVVTFTFFAAKLISIFSTPFPDETYNIYFINFKYNIYLAVYLKHVQLRLNNHRRSSRLRIRMFWPAYNIKLKQYQFYIKKKLTAIILRKLVSALQQNTAILYAQNKRMLICSLSVGLFNFFDRRQRYRRRQLRLRCCKIFLYNLKLSEKLTNIIIEIIIFILTIILL